MYFTKTDNGINKEYRAPKANRKQANSVIYALQESPGTKINCRKDLFGSICWVMDD
jgi:hypothetical protein